MADLQTTYISDLTQGPIQDSTLFITDDGTNTNSATAADVANFAKDKILPEANSYADTKKSEAIEESKEYTNKLLLNDNLIIGGDFSTNPWQRGTSFKSIGNNTYTADRFRLFAQGNCTVVKDGIWLKTTILSGNTGVNTQATILEIPDSMLGETVTLSFYAKSSENVSSQIWIWAGNVITQQIANKTINIDITPQLYSITFKIPESLTNNYLYIWFTRLANLPGVSVWIAKCKLELGNIATQYVPRTIGEELLLCQRYFRTFPLYFCAHTTFAYSGINNQFSINLTPEMRITPTADFVNCKLSTTTSASAIQGVTFSTQSSSKDLLFVVAATTNTTPDAVFVVMSNGGLTLDAEIY